MSFGTTMETPSLSIWKRLVLKSAAFGAGFALMLCVIVGLWLWQLNRRKPQQPWNNIAIKAAFTDLEVFAEADKCYFDFRYSLENTTERDYTVSSDAKLRVRLTKDMSYMDIPEMTWEQGVFIPARQKVNIKVRVPFQYSDYNFSKKQADDRGELAHFANKRLAEIDGFALFDPTDRYRVDFPNGWPEAVKRAGLQHSTEAPDSSVPFAGATKAYRGFTYSFDGQTWKKGQRARRWSAQTNDMEPWSDDQYDPLNILSKEEKAKRLLTEAQIRQVAQRFSVSYEEAWEDAKAQGYQVPTKH
jgi:hypothetical protein